MKRKFTLLILVLVCAFVLAGCECEHVWADADCVTPKTCSECGETEGEALGHSWADATCAAPKTCKSCGLTEGEVADHVWNDATCAAPKTCANCGATEGETLEHTWVDANYQAPQTCSECGATEGEAWPAAFEELGLQFAVEEVGVAYPYTIAGQDYTFTINSYEVTPSDVEGYEWRTVTYTTECLQGDIPYMLPMYHDCNNYYDMEGFNASIGMMETDQLFAMSFTVNYNGEDYTDCYYQMEKSELNYTDSGWTMQERLAFLVPVGFDGIFVCAGDGARITGDYFAQFMDLYTDPNTLFFRLK